MKSLQGFSKKGKLFVSSQKSLVFFIRAKFFPVFLFMLFAQSLCAQYLNMGSLNEYGGGNYFVHVSSESAAKRIITEKVKLNGFPSKQLEFHSGSNLYFCSYHVNPINKEFVYFITCLRNRTGWDIYFYYIENRYRYFYDVNSGGSRIPEVYDPAILESRNITPTKNR